MNTTATIKVGRVGLFLALLLGAFTGHPAATEAAPAPIAQELNSVDAPDIIFSNLGPAFLGRYLVDPHALPVAGKNAISYDEFWQAVAFTPEVDCKAKVLLAAIGYESGDKLVNLGIYTDENGTVGTLLPGGQGSTTEMPDEADCCRLARVTLPGKGVALQANTRYWLVASPDNVDAPTFTGKWHQSNRSFMENYIPEYGGWLRWTSGWPAAEVRGRYLGNPAVEADGADTENNRLVMRSRATLYSTLPLTSKPPFDPAVGFGIIGSNVLSQLEAWRAIPFELHNDAHARTLAAAIGYISGTRLVKIGVYSDNGGLVGSVLPGGEGSTSAIPDAGECCKLTEVQLPGGGVALSRDTPYWLVVSPDDANAPDFYGNWLVSTAALAAYQEPELFINWTSFYGVWLAAEIRGTLP